MPVSSALRVEGEDQRMTVVHQLERATRPASAGHALERLLQLEAQLLGAQLSMSVRLSSTRISFALVDDADAVGHLLGLLDVVRGEDDGDALSRRRRTSAHMSRRSSTSTPAEGSSRNRMRGSWDQRLGDHHAALHAARERHDLGVALVPQRQVAQHALDIARGPAALAEQPAAEVTVAHTVSNASVASSCGTSPILARASR
jgi:hypothetical protein